MGKTAFLRLALAPGRRAGLARAALALAFAGVKLTSPWNPRPIHTGDTPTITALAKLPLDSREFWVGKRPFTLSLVYKLVGVSPHVLVWVQLLLGLGAWLLLADALCRLATSPPLGVLVFTWTLLLALTSNVHVWDSVLRSESLGQSFLVLCLAALLRLFQLRERAPERRGWSWVALALTTGTLAAFSRENIGYVLPLLALLVLAARWPLWARASTVPAELSAIVLAAGLVFASLACQANTRESLRFDFPLTNVIFVRVLPNRARLKYFEHELHMPVSPRILKLAGSFPPEHSSRFKKARDTVLLEEWVHREGYVGYQRYLLSHFGATARDAFKAFGSFATAPVESVAPSTAHAARHAENPVTLLADAIWLENPVAQHPYATWAALAALATGGMLSRTRAVRLASLLSLTLLVASATQTYICFHADAMEVQRHGLVAGLLLRLAGLPSLVVVLAGASVLARKLPRARLSA